MAKLLNFFSRPLWLYDVSPSALGKNVNFVRILFGIILVHRYLDILGFSVLAENSKVMAGNAFSGLILSLLITLGILTPLALIALIFSILDFIGYLGPMVAIIIIWGLLLLGAGRSYSVDAILIKKIKNKTFQTFLRWIYIFALEPKALSQLPKTIGIARLFMLLLFWGVCISAMSYHFLDPLWLKGKVLQLLFATPYLTDYYRWFLQVSDANSTLYNLLASATLYIQAIWELFLLPLMYFRPLQGFVFIWGAGFFVQSFFMMNLGYLPAIEICLWLLIFNYAPVLRLNKATLYYDDRCNLCKRTVITLKLFDFYDCLEVIPLSAAPEAVLKASDHWSQIVLEFNKYLYIGYQSYEVIGKNLFPFLLLYPIFAIGSINGLGETIYYWVAERRHKLFGVCQPFYYKKKNDCCSKRWQSTSSNLSLVKQYLVLPVLLFLAAFSIVSFAIVNPGNPFHVYFNPLASQLQENKAYHFLVDHFGQGPVNVFNQADLNMGSYHIVIYEKDESGEIKRLVPFMDLEGGRLDYLRNDYLYFMLSLRWQRSSIGEKFNNGNISQPSDRTIALIRKVTRLDMCLAGSDHPRQYEATIFAREMIQKGAFLGWSSANPIARIVLPPMKPSNEIAPKNQFYCQHAFDLPPGHFDSKVREERTLSSLKQHEQDNVLVMTLET